MSAAVQFVQPVADPKTEFIRLFQDSPLGVALCGNRGDVTVLNPAMERMLGIEAPWLGSLAFVDLIHAHDRIENQQLIEDLFDGKRANFQFDSRTPGPNGRPVRWTVWRQARANRATDCVFALAEDLPSATAAEHRLHQVERFEAIGRLAGGVAHDFNNLLTGVLLYCDLLLATIEPLHRARHYAEEIRKAGMQATGLVRQLLAVARPATSQPRLLSLNEIAEGMRNLLVRLIGENIELKLQLDPNLGLVKMDPTQTQQILLNLVLNARDAMPRGGVVTIETRNCTIQVLPDSSADRSGASLPCALMVVEDNGHGMDEATRAHLFEPFFTTKAGKGNGLGLATVHDVVTTNGGLIYVDSELGRGTRVSALLPLAPQMAFDRLEETDSSPYRNSEPHSFIKKE